MVSIQVLPQRVGFLYISFGAIGLGCPFILEGEVMSEIYHNGFLHTKSSYFKEASFFKVDKTSGSAYKELFSATNIANDYMKAIDHARSKELAFYHSIFPKVSDYESFMIELRKLFDDCNKIGEKIDRLSNASFKGNY